MDEGVSGTQFIQSLCRDVLNSSAIHHPYLDAIQAGSFPDMDWAFKDFAFQYGLYSGQFVRYLRAVINRLHISQHQTSLRANLAEERGNYHNVDLPNEILSSVDGIPHALLFRRFQEALGVSEQTTAPDDVECPGYIWSRKFLQLCETNQYVGIGAIGLGTEYLVSHIYKQVLDALIEHSSLNRIERVFFELHCQCDDEHANEILSIAADIAVDRESCELIEYGARQAIALRVAFWDRLFERAQNISIPNKACRSGEIATIGY